MSTDASVICHKCKRFVHLGQRFADESYSFGFGSKDEEGRKFAAKWIFNHIEHEKELSIVTTDNIPDDYIGEDDET